MLLTAIVLVCALAFGIGWLEGHDAEQSQERPAKYAEAAKDDAERTCIGLQAGAVFECIREKVRSAYQQSHDEQELSAAQRSAFASLASTLLSAVALVISIIGVWYVKRTLDATLQAVEDTDKATIAMRESNEIARGGQRAWLSVKLLLSQPFRPGETHEGVHGYYAVVDGLIKNHGHNPATNIHYIVETVLWGSGPTPDKALSVLGNSARTQSSSYGKALFSGDDTSFQHSIFISKQSIDEIIAKDNNPLGMISPVIIGCISYLSPYADGVRQTRFMYDLIANKDGRLMAIRPVLPMWWEADIQVANTETIYAD